MSNFENPTPLPSDRKAATRVQILQSALACFAENGYHQTTMDDIVGHSGLSKGALYWHFKSKQELFIALIEWFLLQVDEQITQAWADGMPAADKIRTMAKISLAGGEQMAPFVKIFLDFWAQTPDDEQLQQIFAGIIEDYEGKLEEIIKEGVASGEFHPVENPRSLSLAMFAMLDALFLYYTLLGDKVNTYDAATIAFEVMLEGLTCKGLTNKE